MPNHVTNILRVSGDQKQIRAMFEAIKDDIYLLSMLSMFRTVP